MVKFDLDTCRYIVWGYGPHSVCYHTHGHIHHAIFRTLQHLGKSPVWLDATRNIRSDNFFENALVITNTDCITSDYWPWPVKKESSLPINESCFYVVHGLGDYADKKALFPNNYLSWNVYHDHSATHAPGGAGPIPGAVDPSRGYLLAPDTPFYPKERRMDFRWATDLLPHEIEANKPNHILGQKSEIIHYVGSVWHVNEKEIVAFARECIKDGIKFNQIGAGQRGVVSIEKNRDLIRTSYMAPAIVGSPYLAEGYAPCRIFKNISYGQPGLTNSQRVQDLFEGRLLHHDDPASLYWLGKEQLPNFPLVSLHEQMDYVAKNHTYLNRLASVFEAVRMLV